MSTVSPPRLTRQFQLASDPGLHHPPVLCRRETNLLPLLNAFLFSLYQKYPLLWDLSSGNLARQGFPIARKTPRPLPHPATPLPSPISHPLNQLELVDLSFYLTEQKEIASARAKDIRPGSAAG